MPFSQPRTGFCVAVYEILDTSTHLHLSMMSSFQKRSGWHPQGNRAPADNGAELQLTAARKFLAVPWQAGSIGREPRYAEAFSSASGVFLPTVYTNTCSLVVPGICFRSQNNTTNYHTCITAARTGRAMCHRVSPHTPAAIPKLLLMGTHGQEPRPQFHLPL